MGEQPQQATATGTGSAAARTYEQVLTDAIRVLTEAARLTRATPRRRNLPDQTAEPAVEPIDWAEFATQALAGAAANIGGVDAVLAGRPGSWEADALRTLLLSTVGHDEQYLLAHRTEPVVVGVFVNEILNDLGVWGQYDEAAQALVDRACAVDPTAEDQEEQLDLIAEAEECLEQQRERAWAAYGDALRAYIHAGAAGRPGLTVPVQVDVDLHSFRSPSEFDEAWGLAGALLDEAVAAVAIPVIRPPG